MIQNRTERNVGHALWAINILLGFITGRHHPTAKLRSYGVAHRELMPETIHSTKQYENNRAEQSHEATRVRERGMRKFKSVHQAQGILGTYAAVQNLFNLGRHLVRAEHYRNLRVGAFSEWSRAVA